MIRMHEKVLVFEETNRNSADTFMGLKREGGGEDFIVDLG